MSTADKMVAIAAPTPALPATTPEALKAAAAAQNATEEVAPVFDMSTLFVDSKADRESAAHALASLSKNDVTVFETHGLAPALIKALGDKKSAAARDGAIEVISILIADGQVKPLEAIIINGGVFPALLETFADKAKATQTAAVAAVVAFVQAMSPWATVLVLPSLLTQIKTAGKWQIKTGSLAVLNQLVASASVQVARATPEIVPVLAEAIWDTKADVKKAARETLTKVTALVSNKDIERLVLASYG